MRIEELARRDAEWSGSDRLSHLVAPPTENSVALAIEVLRLREALESWRIEADAWASELNAPILNYRDIASRIYHILNAN